MLKTLEDLEKTEIREHLNKCWMTHDAMWLFHCLQEMGIEKTNKINLAAVRDMSTIEIKRICKLLGRPQNKPVESFEELYALIDAAFGIVKADFMHFKHYAPEHNCLQWEMEQCFAHDGLARMGAIAGYQCGILERMRGWMDALGVAYTMEPQIKGCLMHTQGSCRGVIRTQFQNF